MQDVIKMRGCLEIVLSDPHGNVVDKQTINNTIVTVGRRWVLQQIASSDINTAQSIGYMAVGTSTAAPATGDTALGDESSRIAINSFTTSNLTSNPPSWRAEASWATNLANTTLGEVGLFVTSAAGTMLGRATFSTVNKTTSNTLSISYTVSN
jgi:hypothetical protein